jgi:hypothetical protein
MTMTMIAGTDVVTARGKNIEIDSARGEGGNALPLFFVRFADACAGNPSLEKR